MASIVPDEPANVTLGAWQPDLNADLICPVCKEHPPNLVEEFSAGDMVCASCGLILGGRIVDTRSEWRTFSNDDQGGDDPSRVGEAANPLLDGSQLHTSIAFGGGVAGRSKDLQRAQNKANQNKNTKTLVAAYKEIDTFCESMSIPRAVADSAKGQFKEVHDAGAFRGKSQETLIAGVIFISCRQHKVPRTFREIFALTKVTKAEIGRIFKALERFFEEKNQVRKDQAASNTRDFQQNPPLYSSTQSTDPKELCERYCNQLGLPFSIIKISQDIADRMDAGGMLAGRSPLSIAAVSIYMASHLMGHAKSAKEISGVAGVSDGTIRNAYRLVHARKDRLFEPEWLETSKHDLVGRLSNLPSI